jgi:hypothetical protein
VVPFPTIAVASIFDPDCRGSIAGIESLARPLRERTTDADKCVKV